MLSSSGGCCGFIDFSKAFENVNRETLFKTLKQFQISSKLLNLIQNMYSKLKCQVRTSAGESDMFSKSNGVMQGECLSPTLFTAYINEIERLMNGIDEMGMYLNGVKLSVIMYADDIVLISKTKHGLQLGMNALYVFCSANTLTVNTNKSEVMYISERIPASLQSIIIICLSDGLTALDILVLTFIGLSPQ